MYHIKIGENLIYMACEERNIDPIAAKPTI
jgi:hypothetical protein